MNWFIFSLLSITALAAAELTQQYLLNVESHFDERTSAVFTFLVQAILTIPIILFTNLRSSFLDIFNPDVFPYLLIVSLIVSFSMIFYLRSFKVRNISISTIFVSLSIVVSTTLGILFLNETFYPHKIIGICLVLLAIISLNIKNFQIERNHYYGLFAGLLYGVSYTIDKMVVLTVNPIIYIFWSFTFISCFGLLFGSKTVINSVRLSKIKDYKPIIFSGFAYFLYNFFTYTSYARGGEVGRVDAINNSQVFLIILAEYFVLKHKEGFGRKIATAVLAFLGVMILGFL